MAYYYKAGVIVPFVQKFYKQMIVVVAGLFIASMAAMTLSASAATTTIYNATPSILPSSLPSLGYEATDTAEFGDKISFAGTDRSVSSATVTMVSWACQTGQWQDGDCASTEGSYFTHPITLKVYNANPDGTVGSVITTVSNNFNIPFRPSVDSSCANDPGRTYPTAWKNSDGVCQNGYAHNITFDLAGVTLPDQIIYGISFNTSTSGYTPLIVGGPYDALNVGLTDNTLYPTVGTDVDNDSVYWNSALYGDGTFKVDNDWSPYTISIKFDANKAVVNYEAAPAVANKVLKASNIDARYGKGKTGGNHISDVAKEMGAGTDFRGVPKNEANAYKCAIVDFLRTKTNPALVPANGEECYELVDTVNIPANSSTATLSAISLDSSKDYRLVATGTANAGDNIDFDAVCSLSGNFSGDTWSDLVTGYEGYGPTLLELKVNDSFGNWGSTCSEEHEYTKMLNGVLGPVSFLIYDAYYPNNTGSLKVDIYESVF